MNHKRIHLLTRSLALSVFVLIVSASATPARAEAAYGAIAINPSTGAWGVSWEARTRRGAKRLAVRKCGDGCRTAVWVQNQCAAVVASDGNYLAAAGSTKRRALRNARRGARDRRAPRVAWVCSGRR